MFREAFGVQKLAFCLRPKSIPKKLPGINFFDIVNFFNQLVLTAGKSKLFALQTLRENNSLLVNCLNLVRYSV